MPIPKEFSVICLYDKKATLPSKFSQLNVIVVIAVLLSILVFEITPTTGLSAAMMINKTKKYAEKLSIAVLVVEPNKSLDQIANELIDFNKHKNIALLLSRWDWSLPDLKLMHIMIQQ